MPPERTVLMVEIRQVLSGELVTLPVPYDDAEILPDQAIIFHKYESGMPDSEIIDTYVLPWHAIEGCHMQRISTEQFARTMRDQDPRIGSQDGSLKIYPAPFPACFGTRTADGPACPECPVLTNCVLKFQESL